MITLTTLTLLILSGVFLAWLIFRNSLSHYSIGEKYKFLIVMILAAVCSIVLTVVDLVHHIMR